MKKIVSLLLALSMLLCLFALSSCDTTNNDTNKDPSESQTNNGSENEGTNEITFTEQVAVDNDECLIKITKLDPDSFWGYTLKVQLENKSDDKTYMFSVESASINGVQCDPFFASEVAAGKKANEEITFMASELEEAGIKDFTDIELTFRVYDTNDWMADEVANETVNIYPYGKDKATKYVREQKASDKVILDNDYVTVIVTGYEDDAIWGYTAKLFLLNKSDKNIMFSAEEVSVNGYMADPYFATSVSAGKCAFSSMSWSDTIFEENGITTVESIEFNLIAYDMDNLFDGNLAEKTVTLNP